MVELLGKKCRLRSVVSSDVDTILLWENDPTLAPYSAPHEPYTREQIAQFVSNQQFGFKANGQIRLIIEFEGRSIGAIDLFDYDGKCAEVGIVIYEPQMRQRGFATDALLTVKSAARSLDIQTLTAVVDKDNTASNALFSRCGFVKNDKNRYICSMKRIVAPSILSADFGNLERDTQMLNRSAAEWVHVDVMDGVFVPNISFGFPVLKAVTKASTKVIDTHLMICDPIRYVEKFAKAGSHYVTFHYEAAEDIDACIDAIHNAGAKAGISIKPATDVSAIKPWLTKLDMVLIMSVEPGFGGQSFMPHSLDKVRELKKMIAEAGTECIIEIDGGISAANAAEVFEAGVEVVVAGSAVFCAEDPEGEIVKILNS
ncbi:MAG: ribulose-phosphate 3-epimerase [Alistipes sp.]|nr:ribulose-phosphate 3-epimerase [Alistipes sp.]